MTAMVARRRAASLDTVLAPDFPKRRMMGTYSQNVSPAIMKSETVMPKRLRMIFPIAKKITATMVAVTTDCTMIRLIFGRSSPPVKS
jgi:hypothetical protein